MQCPICKSEAPPPPSICPRCESLVSLIPESRPSRSDRLVWLLLLLFLVLVAAPGIVGYRMQKKFVGENSPQKHTAAANDELTVVHGNLVRPGELRSTGQLYFIPVGSQVVAVQSLADYYDKKFGIQIHVLPEVALDASACLPARKQCIAEELILAAKRAHRKIADDPDSTMIVLTDEDLYPRSLGWKFTYAFYSDYRFGIVSTHRMNPAVWHDPPNDEKTLASTRQMLTYYIALYGPSGGSDSCQWQHL